MDKEALKSLDLSDEQIGKIIEMHENDINGAFIPKTRFDELNESNKTLKEQLAQSERVGEELRKSADDSEKIAAQLSELKAKYETDLKSLEEKGRQSALDAAMSLEIAKAHGKNPAVIKALVDRSNLNLNADGSVDGLDGIINSLKKSDPYLFEQVETRRQGTGFNGGKGGQSSEFSSTAETFRKALNR
jgi:hypothetical protein